jgi:F-type H+-transporting ATPase subunit epsilon
MFVKVITPEQQVFEGEVNQAKFPGISGEFEVLKDHAALISTLNKGKMMLNTVSEGQKEYMIEGGVVEILNNQISVLIEGLVNQE